MGGRRFSGSFSWSAATERLVNAIPVVINSELFKLSPQVDCVPDQHVVKDAAGAASTTPRCASRPSIYGGNRGVLLYEGLECDPDGG